MSDLMILLPLFFLVMLTWVVGLYLVKSRNEDGYIAMPIISTIIYGITHLAVLCG